MKRILLLFGLSTAVLLLALALNGCYTQLGTVSNGSGYNDDYAPPSQDDSSYAYDQGMEDGDQYQNQPGDYTYNDSWWYNHPRVGMNYYYPSYYWPSMAFDAAYNDPWFYDSYWNSYDPWICGTPYVRYPYYGGLYSPYYGSYYGYYGYGYGYGVNYGGGYGYGTYAASHRTRNFGSTRGSNDATVGGRGTNNPGYVQPPSMNTGGGSLPVGARWGGSTNNGRTSGGNRSGVTNTSTRGSNSPQYGIRGSSGSRGSNNNGTSGQVQPNGSSAPQGARYNAPKNNNGTHQGNGQGRGANSGNRRGGSSRGQYNPPSYNPPPSNNNNPPPTYTAPSTQPSNGGGNSSGSSAPSGGSGNTSGGSRGSGGSGGNRGGRP